MIRIARNYYITSVSGFAGIETGGLDRLLDKKFIENQSVWMGVKTLDDPEEKSRA